MKNIDEHPEVVHFFEREIGLHILHRILLASQIVITQFCSGGIRQVCRFLEFSGLNQFVASSYGTQQQDISTIEEKMGDFDKELDKIYADCKAGKLLCGECKQISCNKMTEFMQNLEEGIEKARKNIDKLKFVKFN